MIIKFLNEKKSNFKFILKLLVLIFAFKVKNLLGQSQELLLAKYKPAILNQTNTADSCDYLSDQEKKTIQICNLARTNGKLFVDNILLNYPEIIANMDNNKYVGSLLTQMEKISNLPLLYPDYFYYKLAKQHATEMGLSGKTGHHGSEERFSKMMKKTDALKCGENCDYGYDKALDIVLHLLIDDGIASLGHRKNILDKDFNTIGVSIMPHQKYEYNCVQLFAAKGLKSEISLMDKILFWKKNK